jgi:hypothetical protein
MLEVIFPKTFVLCTVLVDVNSIPVGFIVLPLSFEDVAVYMPELSLATGFVVFPLTLVSGSIWPNLGPEAMFHISKPGTLVHSPIFENDIISLF